MTQWLLQHGPWSFIVLAFAVFALAMLFDALPPLLKERTLLRQLRAELKRTKDPSP